MKRFISFSLLLFSVTVLFFACSKKNDVIPQKTANELAEQDLLNNLNNLNSSYKPLSHPSTKELGTWGGVAQDIMGGIGGASWGAPAGPVGMFCLGLSFGICASAFDIPHYNTYTDPCTGVVTMSSTYSPVGQAWYNTYQNTPQLHTSNPYNQQGLFHNIILTQAPCDVQFQNATLQQKYSQTTNLTISYLQNGNLPLDSGLMKNSGAKFVTMMGLLAPLNPNDPNYVSTAMNILIANNYAVNDIATQSISTYMVGLKGVSSFSNFVSYQSSFENQVINSSIETNTKNRILLVLAIGKFSYLYWNQ